MSHQNTNLNGIYPTLEQQIAQKIMLDLRFFDEENKGSPKQTPVTTLPHSLAHLITETCLGGVILFSENLHDVSQIVSLTNALQLAAKRSALALPLFISADHEGGKVARLPRHLATSFTGNMSIGATPKGNNEKNATLVAETLAKELAALGINVNHAPTIDVNSNPDNPVINVRAFGENPSTVAKLGSAQVTAFQKHQVIATLKHFPGHGDTDIDSHTGLPQVNKTIVQIESSDLIPFRKIIADECPGMIMTAHIQYPKIDNIKIHAKNGNEIFAPATMSRRIMHDLLRKDIGYQGIIITDALDMAGISDYFTAPDTVLKVFAADIDIALMPLKIRTEADLNKLPSLINKIANLVRAGKLDTVKITESYLRIKNLKQQYLSFDNIEKPIGDRIKFAESMLSSPTHKKIEQDIAEQSITLVKGEPTELKLAINKNNHKTIIMPDMRKCQTLSSLLADKKLTNDNLIDLNSEPVERDFKAIADSEIIIAGLVTPQQSLVEFGGLDDRHKLSDLNVTIKQQKSFLIKLLTYANQLEKKVVFISLRAPYDISEFSRYSDFILASYAYSIDFHPQDQSLISPAFYALAKVLTGKLIPKGRLPVSIK